MVCCLKLFFFCVLGSCDRGLEKGSSFGAYCPWKSHAPEGWLERGVAVLVEGLKKGVSSASDVIGKGLSLDSLVMG